MKLLKNKQFIFIALFVIAVFTIAAIGGTTNMIGTNDADNAASTSTVAANRDGSILERLEHLLDALVDDETTNLIGYNDSNNAATTSSVASNRDGSVLERLEDMLDYDLRSGTTTTGDVKSDNLFQVSGGPIKIKSMIGYVVTGIQAQATTCKIIVDPNEPATNTDLCATLDLTGDAAGTLYVVSGDPNEPLQEITNGVTPLTNSATSGVTQYEVICPEGMIEATMGATSTGSIKWVMQWEPVESGTTVIVQ